jgi:hypothetical protein
MIDLIVLHSRTFHKTAKIQTRLTQEQVERELFEVFSFFEAFDDLALPVSDANDWIPLIYLFLVVFYCIR